MLAAHAYSFIKDVVMPTSKGNYLEIGVWNGQGISTLANQYKNKNFYGIDPFIEDGNTSHISHVEKKQSLSLIKETALANISKHSNIQLFQETSENFYNRMNKDNLSTLNVDTIFIDGDHSTAVVIIDYNLAIKLLGEKQGTIIFDDLQVPDVANAVEMFKEQFSNIIRNSQKITNTCELFEINF